MVQHDWRGIQQYLKERVTQEEVKCPNHSDLQGNSTSMRVCGLDIKGYEEHLRTFAKLKENYWLSRDVACYVDMSESFAFKIAHY